MLLFLLLLVAVAGAQPALRYPNLVGVVYTKAAATNYEGVADVEVQVLDGQRVQASTTTDPKGYFQFENVPEGTYRVRCSKAGYPAVEGKPVRVSKGEC